MDNNAPGRIPYQVCHPLSGRFSVRWEPWNRFLCRGSGVGTANMQGSRVSHHEREGGRGDREDRLPGVRPRYRGAGNPLPEEKLWRIRRTLHAWRDRRSCSKRELLSRIGTLQHASTVVKPGRTLLRRMIDLSKRQVHLDSHLRLNVDFRADLQWWATFIETWNGVSILSALCKRPIDVKVVSDASGSWGCGAYFRDKWFSLPWSLCPSWADIHISVKELLPYRDSLRNLGSGDGKEPRSGSMR